MKVGKVKKAHKNEPALNCLCLLKKGPLTMRSLCGGALAAGGAMAALAGRVHILLREHPLTARVSSRSICKGSGSSSGGGGRRNDDRWDGGDHREGQRVAMNNGTEDMLISRSGGGDGLLYCRGNGCAWHRGGSEGLREVRLDLALLLVVCCRCPLTRLVGGDTVFFFMFFCIGSACFFIGRRLLK